MQDACLSRSAVDIATCLECVLGGKLFFACCVWYGGMEVVMSGERVLLFLCAWGLGPWKYGGLLLLWRCYGIGAALLARWIRLDR